MYRPRTVNAPVPNRAAPIAASTSPAATTAPAALLTSEKPPPSQAPDEAAFAGDVTPASASVADPAEAATRAVGHAMVDRGNLGMGAPEISGGTRACVPSNPACSHPLPPHVPTS